MIKKIVCTMVLCLALSPAIQAQDAAPVKQFTFRLAGIDVTSLMPEVAKVAAFCYLKGANVNSFLGAARQEFSVTQVNGENVAHTGPFTIGVNVGDDGIGANAQPTDVKSWQCYFALVHRDGRYFAASRPCESANQWACAKIGSTSVASQSGQF